MCELVKEMLEIAYRGKASAATVKAQYLLVWESFVDVMSAIMTVDDSKLLEPQAQRIQELANFFGSVFEKYLPRGSTCVYFHDLWHHAAEVSLEFGNLSKWSQQGLEHLHRWHKLFRSQCGKAATAGRDAMLKGNIKRVLEAKEVARQIAVLAEYNRKFSKPEPHVPLEEVDD